MTTVKSEVLTPRFYFSVSSPVPLHSPSQPPPSGPTSGPWHALLPPSKMPHIRGVVRIFISLGSWLRVDFGRDPPEPGRSLGELREVWWYPPLLFWLPRSGLEGDTGHWLLLLSRHLFLVSVSLWPSLWLGRTHCFWVICFRKKTRWPFVPHAKPVQGGCLVTWRKEWRMESEV